MVVKNEEVKELLSNLRIRTLLSKIPVLDDILFWMCTYKMNEIVNKFLLAGNIFMPQMHLKQPGFTYRTCGTFTKNKEKIQKFKETGNTTYIYKNELDKACFQHNMASGGFKDLAGRTASDKILREKTFDIC